MGIFFHLGESAYKNVSWVLVQYLEVTLVIYNYTVCPSRIEEDFDSFGLDRFGGLPGAGPGTTCETGGRLFCNY